MPQLSEEKKRLLLDRVMTLEEADKSSREHLLRMLMRNEHYWQGDQYLYFDILLNSWRSPAFSDFEEVGGKDAYDEYIKNTRVVNIYKMHGESIIAALTSATPAVRFSPDDADNPHDINTARAHTNVAKLIQKDNKTKPILKRALYTLFNQHFVAAYTYNERDKKNGTTQYKYMDSVEKDTMVCQACDAEKTDSKCECGSELDSIPGQAMVREEVTEERPKAKQVIKVYGPRNVKLPMWIRTVEESPYLILEYDEHYMKCNDEYPKFNFKPEFDSEMTDRLSRETFEEPDTPSLVTKKYCWVRSWALPEGLKKEFPNGAKITIINDEFVAIVDERLEDHWVVAENPLATYLHAQPHGEGLIDMQDIKNDIKNFTLNCLEHSVVQTFADEAVINFPKYKQQHQKVGTLYPAKAPADGTGLDKGFFSMKAAEVPHNIHQIDASNSRDSQDISGDFPSIAGAPQESGSKTLGEYQESRAYALQRLSLLWDMLNLWWADVIDIAVRQFIEHLQPGEEYKMAERSGHQFINIWIRKTQMSGTVGSAEPESNEAFPSSQAQKKASLINFMQYGGEAAMALLSSANNVRKIFDILGFSDLEIPSSTQADKQLEEIALIERFQMPAPVDILADDHMTHADTLRQYMASDKGMDAKDTNPVVYQSLQQHLLQHIQGLIMMEQFMAHGTANLVRQKKKNQHLHKHRGNYPFVKDS